VRDQLWAEGAELWRRHGVVWRGAVELAPERHQQYKIEDPWREVVERWLGEADIDGNLNAARLDLATSTVLGEALNIHSGQYDKAKANRLGAVMRSLGYDIAVSRSTWLEGEARKNLRKVWRPQKPLLLMFPNKKRG
jgi:predicted P-loop ATPase